MANRLAIDIELNAQKYKDGAKQATQSTESLKKATDDYLKDFGPLRKQLAAAKKEAQNLAGQFMLLGKAEKESEFGKELAAQLDEAIHKAAELQDVMGDVGEAIKNASSDTGDFDAIKEGLETTKSATLALVGTFTQLTGTEDQAAKIIKNLAVVENSFNAAISITNTLQSKSKVMTALVNNGLISLATATKIETTALKAMGTAMKALPFVAVGAGVLTLGKAFVDYMSGANKATKEVKNIEEELTGVKKTLNDVANTFNGNYASALGKTLSTYKQLQTEYKTLTSDHQKTQWIKENADKFKDLGLSVNTVNDADKILIKQSADIIEAFKLRAKAAAEASRLQDLYVKRIEAETEARRRANKKQIKAGDSVQAGDVDRFGLQEGIDYQQYKHTVGMFYTDTGAMKAQQALAANNIRTYTKDIDAEIEASADRLAAAEEEYNKKLGNLGVTPTGSGSSNLTKEQQTKLQKLEDKVKELQKELENVDITGPNAQQVIEDLQNKLKIAQQAVKDYKIAIGLEVGNVDETLKRLQEAVSKAQTDYINAVKADDDAAKAVAKETYYKAQDALNKYKLSITIEPKFDEEKFKQSLNKIAKDVFEPEAKKWDFSGFDFMPNGEKLAKTAENAVSQISKFKNAIEELNKLKGDTTDTKAKEQIDSMIDSYQRELDVLESKANMLERLSEAEKKHAEAVEINRQAYDMLFSSLGTVGSALRDLGATEAAQAVEFVANSAQMIAQCIQNIAALQAQAIASGVASGAALPFPANLAAIASIVATITAIFASLAKFEQGGIIGGNSYSGDRLLIRANSSEMLLNQRQQNRLLQIANGMITPASQSDFGLISAKVRGRDLILVMNNELKSNRKEPIA